MAASPSTAAALPVFLQGNWRPSTRTMEWAPCDVFDLRLHPEQDRTWLMQCLTQMNRKGSFTPTALAFLLVFSQRRLWLLFHLAQTEREGTVEAAMRRLFAADSTDWRRGWLDRCLTQRTSRATDEQRVEQPTASADGSAPVAWMVLKDFCALLVTRAVGLLGAGPCRVEDRWLLEDELLDVLENVRNNVRNRPLSVVDSLKECIDVNTPDDVRALGLPLYLPLTILHGFPDCQERMRAVNSLCWYFKPERVQQVLAQYRAGELQLGDGRYYRHYHIRPVQFHGRSMTQKELDEYDDEGSFAWRWVSFDVIDAEGRELPLLAKYRGDSPDAPCNTCSAVIRHRESLNRIAYAACERNQEEGEATLHAHASNLLVYSPHGHIDEKADADMAHDDDEEESGKAAPTRNFKRDIQGTWISRWTCPRDRPELRELAQLLTVALGLAYFHPESYEGSPALYSDNHPLDVRRLFTRAAIERTEEAERILALPAPLVDCIVEWALVDLPYVKDEWSEEDKERMYAFCNEPDMVAPALTVGARIQI